MIVAVASQSFSLSLSLACNYSMRMTHRIYKRTYLNLDEKDREKTTEHKIRSFESQCENAYEITRVCAVCVCVHTLVCQSSSVKRKQQQSNIPLFFRFQNKRDILKYSSPNGLILTVIFHLAIIFLLLFHLKRKRAGSRRTLRSQFNVYLRSPL